MSHFISPAERSIYIDGIGRFEASKYRQIYDALGNLKQKHPVPFDYLLYNAHRVYSSVYYGPWMTTLSSIKKHNRELQQIQKQIFERWKEPLLAANLIKNDLTLDPSTVVIICNIVKMNDPISAPPGVTLFEFPKVCRVSDRYSPPAVK